MIHITMMQMANANVRGLPQNREVDLAKPEKRIFVFIRSQIRKTRDGSFLYSRAKPPNRLARFEYLGRSLDVSSCEPTWILALTLASR